MLNRLGKKSILGALAVGLALAGGAAGYFYFFRAPPLVKVATATLRPASEFVYASGTVEPVESAKVVPFQRRRLTEICRCEGQKVTKGQILGRQDDTEERGTLKEMQIRHEQLVRDLDRAQKDRDKGGITKAEIEQRDTAVRESSSRINAQESRVETLVIRAPMDGTVLQHNGEVGEIVGPTDMLFWIGKASPLQVVADINEEEITKIAVGQKAFLSNEAFARQALRASVSRITPKGDPTKKTFGVNLLLPPDSPLMIGMTVDANIVFNEKRAAVLVPVNAILGGTVQVLTDDVVHRVPVSAGIRGNEFIEITAGVSAGALVLSPARRDFKDGARVRADRSSSQGSAGTDNGDVAVSTALAGHIDAIVKEARKNAAKSP
jgi:RND family efflux transporter MFP subunit